jgi:5-deoxy-5-amino-3-dehydroquinate synthase
VVASYDLPMRVPEGLDPEEIVDLFTRDKKAVDGVTLVLDGPRGIEAVRVDSRSVLLDALGATQ